MNLLQFLEKRLIFGYVFLIFFEFLPLILLLLPALIHFLDAFSCLGFSYLLLGLDSFCDDFMLECLLLLFLWLESMDCLFLKFYSSESKSVFNIHQFCPKYLLFLHFSQLLQILWFCWTNWLSFLLFLVWKISFCNLHSSRSSSPFLGYRTPDFAMSDRRKCLKSLISHRPPLRTNPRLTIHNWWIR